MSALLLAGGGAAVSRHGWKQAERDAASILHGRRFPANMGGAVDVEGDRVVAQVKNVKRFSLLQSERAALDIERVGNLKNKTGIVMVHRSAGRGKETPWLVVMTEGTFQELIQEP